MKLKIYTSHPVSGKNIYGYNFLKKAQTFQNPQKWIHGSKLFICNICGCFKLKLQTIKNSKKWIHEWSDYKYG